MAETVWYRRPDGREFEFDLDSPALARVIREGEFNQITGPGGEIIPKETAPAPVGAETKPAEKEVVDVSHINGRLDNPAKNAGQRPGRK